MIATVSQPIATKYPPFTWRSASRADAGQLHALLLERDRIEGVQLAGTLTDFEKEFEDAWLKDLDQQTLIAVTSDGAAAAMGFIFINPEPFDKRQAYLWLEIHPDHSLPGLRYALAEWAKERASILLRALPGDLPRVIGVSTQDVLKDRLEVYDALGFERVRNFYHMRRDLVQPIDIPVLYDGLELVTYQSEQSDALRDTFNEAFADHWNFTPVTEEDWQMWFVGGEDFRPDLTYLVMDEGEIAAFSVNGVNPQRNQQRGIQEGWVHQLGTRRPWRKRGLATALLNASMQAFKLEGLDYATLGVDTANPTGALRVYERVAFSPVKTFVVHEFRLDGNQLGD